MVLSTLNAHYHAVSDEQEKIADEVDGQDIYELLVREYDPVYHTLTQFMHRSSYWTKKVSSTRSKKLYETTEAGSSDDQDEVCN